MTSKIDYKNMSDGELEKIALEDPEATWELLLRLPDKEIADSTDWEDTQPMPPIILLDD